MNGNGRDTDKFADIIIDDGNSASTGYDIPPKGSGDARQHSRYAGMGAYRRRTETAKPEEQVITTYDSDLALIGRVEVFSWGARRSFYERFREDAEKYRNTPGRPAEYVPFFSYIPQYSQMNLYQLNYYLYFRECARRRAYIEADLAYILLYIYEIINLSDTSEPEKDIEILTGGWMHYRDTYPALDKYMAEWVCDFCLLYRLSVPECTLSILPKLCESATLKEFYMSAAIQRGGGLMQGDVLEAFADYNYRTSRVELPPELACHFAPAIGRAAAALGQESFVSDEAAIVSRFAFCGSLCSHNVKRRITVEYYPAFKRTGARHMLGAAAKYTENKLRRAAGIKSRLHTDGLPDSARLEIDRYFEEIMPDIFTKKSAPKITPVPDYERLYDAPDLPFSPEMAAKIELESRAAAELLGGETDDDAASAIQDDVSAANNAEESSAPDKAEDSEPTENGGAGETDTEHRSASSGTSEIIKFMLEGGSLEEFCRARGILPDTAAAEVNEAAADFFGDVLLEYSDGAWQIIDDYLEEAAEMAVACD